MNNRIKNILIRYSPGLLLEAVKSFLKNRRRKYLKNQSINQNSIPFEKLIADLKSIGLEKGDAVIVHCSLSKIGYVENGAKTIINLLEEVIGKEGTLLMPAFTASGRNKTYLETKPVFDVKNTPSKMGIVSEVFRTQENVFRSLHPTDSVCAKGPLAAYFTNTHFGQLTPYNEFSPFRKLCERNGKILMFGTTLNGACTNLHTLEDALPFKYPVYDSSIFDVEMVDEKGNRTQMKTKVHNPEYSSKRNCDALKPLFIKEGILKEGLIGEANSMLIDAKGLLEVMINYYNKYGVTMYTPFGDNGKMLTS